MMLSNLNLSSLPECNFEVRYVDSVLLNPAPNISGCPHGQGCTNRSKLFGVHRQ